MDNESIEIANSYSPMLKEILEKRNSAYSNYITTTLLLITTFLSISVSLIDLDKISCIENMFFKILISILGLTILVGSLVLYLNVILIKNHYSDVLKARNQHAREKSTDNILIETTTPIYYTIVKTLYFLLFLLSIVSIVSYNVILK